MQVVGKSLQRANLVYVLPQGYRQPEPSEVLSLFTSEQVKGATFVDDPVMNLRIFGLPMLRLKVVFEELRLRIEDETQADPAASPAVEVGEKVRSAVLASVKPTAFGFNYDIIFRAGQVIPLREIMAQFVRANMVEDIKDFGWQFTVQPPQQQKLATYFCKAVSPLELVVHTNQHFNKPVPPPAELKKMFEECYAGVDGFLKDLAF